jgi:hypothetical protein
MVGCSSFDPGGPIPQRFSEYGNAEKPVVTWSGTPPGTKSLCLVIEDPDAPGSEPFVHWLLVDMTAESSHTPGNGREGANSSGGIGYFGPKPPPGPPHHYHFEVFALDRSLGPGVQDRDAAVHAMTGHVLAKGRFIGTFQNPG